MRVLVTGASGFVGPHVCAALIRAGHQVVAAGRRSPEIPGASGVSLDVTDAAAVKERLSAIGPEAIIHLAGDAIAGGSWDRHEQTMTVNVIGAGNLLVAVAGVVPGARVVLVGSAHQYGGDPGRPLRESDPLAPASPYAVSKAAQEMLGAAWAGRGLRVIMTRSFNHTGPGAPRSTAAGAFCAQIAEIEAGGVPVIRTGDLSSERDFVDVRDVAGAYVTLLERGNDGLVYNVGSGRGYRVEDILWMAVDASRMARYELTVERAQPELVPERAGDPQRLVADIGRIAALGWEPAISIERSIADTLASHRTIVGNRP